MRSSLKRKLLPLTCLGVLGIGSVATLGATPGPDPERNSRISKKGIHLLTQIQAETNRLIPYAEQIDIYTRTARYNRVSHAASLEGVRQHINAVGERIRELQRIRGLLPTWQQLALDEVTANAAEVATSTQAAILHLNEIRSHTFTSPYRDHLSTIVDRSEEMKLTVDTFLQYHAAKLKLQSLESELEISGTG